MSDVVIVGAGLAGLVCAQDLTRAGVQCTVLEASDGTGGRVRTDAVDGFLLDRGFQILLTAYPQVHARLDLAALALGEFEPRRGRADRLRHAPRQRSAAPPRPGARDAACAVRVAARHGQGGRTRPRRPPWLAARAAAAARTCERRNAWIAPGFSRRVHRRLLAAAVRGNRARPRPRGLLAAIRHHPADARVGTHRASARRDRRGPRADRGDASRRGPFASVPASRRSRPAPSRSRTVERISARAVVVATDGPVGARPARKPRRRPRITRRRLLLVLGGGGPRARPRPAARRRRSRACPQRRRHDRGAAVVCAARPSADRGGDPRPPSADPPSHRTRPRAARAVVRHPPRRAHPPSY